MLGAPRTGEQNLVLIILLMYGNQIDWFVIHCVAVTIGFESICNQKVNFISMLCHVNLKVYYVYNAQLSYTHKYHN